MPVGVRSNGATPGLPKSLGDANLRPGQEGHLRVFDHVRAGLADLELRPDREQFLLKASAALPALAALGFLLWNKSKDPKLRKRAVSRIGEKNLDRRGTLRTRLTTPGACAARA